MGASDDIALGRGANEAARELVRHFEKRGQLDALLAKLRDERPLVEWPEAEPAPPSPYAPPMDPIDAVELNPSMESGAPLPSPGTLSSSSAPLPSPGTLSSSSSAPLPSPGALSPPSGPPLIDPFLAKPAGPTVPMADAPPKSASADRGSSPPRPPAGPSSQGFAWPGTVGGGAEPSAPSRGIDPKIFIVVSGLMLLAALIAFIAGRSGSSSGSSADASSTAEPAGKKSGDGASDDTGADGEGATASGPPTPGSILAHDIARSLANVARACEIPIRGAVGEDVLLRAFDQCGPPPAPVRPIADPLPPRQDDPLAGRPNDNGGGAGAQRPAGNAQRPANNPQPPPPATPPGGECMRSCDSEHRACTNRCGKEPTQSSLYAEYTGCLSRCLTTASRCRLSCK